MRDTLRHFVEVASPPVRAGAAAPPARRSALEQRMHAKRQRCDQHKVQRMTPFQRMQACRDSLARLDQGGWNRSYHQRLFHEDFLVRVPV